MKFQLRVSKIQKDFVGEEETEKTEKKENG